MIWTLVEPCCGTAALSLWLLSHGLMRHQLVPRQGSKWGLRRELTDIVRQLGFEGPPSEVVLTDASPWAVAIAGAMEWPESVAAFIRSYVRRDPAHVHALLHGREVPSDSMLVAAELFWLQRMAYAGKAVRVVDGRWSSPGLNETSAYGVEETDNFGAVRPMGDALLSALAGMPRGNVRGSTGLARPLGRVTRPTLVYLDPPYAGTTGYGCDLSRDEVVALALEWEAAGAVVLVSEAEAVAELGWPSLRIGDGGGGDKPVQFRKAREEWVTASRPVRIPVQLGLFKEVA